MNKGGSFLKIGHRGAAGYEPENTLVSFKKALELNIDAVELDVYKCKTGELVVIHDDKVDRTTNGKGYVFDKSFNDLRLLNAGNGEKIPLLNEVLDLIDNKIIVNIELKGEDTAKPVSEIIKKYIKEKNWSEKSFIVSSFNHYELNKFKKMIPGIEIGACLTGIPINYAEFAEKAEAKFISLNMEFINKEFVKDAHKRGIKVFVWTVNDEDDIKRMMALGIDGIFSNFPDRLKQI
jgi:glycerophosphoryl diester phosphodiesterase